MTSFGAGIASLATIRSHSIPALTGANSANTTGEV